MDRFGNLEGRRTNRTMEEAEALSKGEAELKSVLHLLLPVPSSSDETCTAAVALAKLSLEGEVAGEPVAGGVKEKRNGGFGIEEKSGEESEAEGDERRSRKEAMAAEADEEYSVMSKVEQVKEKVIDREELTGKADGTSHDKEVEKKMVESIPYPQRPGMLDCAYYLRTGICAYGENCKFNHPPRTIVRDAEKELAGCSGHAECKFFLTPGGCKFGNSCKFSHSHEKNEIQGTNVNFLGLPIRPGQKECPYYMRTGSCKFSSNCWYDHPDPKVVNAPNSVLSCQNVASTQHASVETNLPALVMNSGLTVQGSDSFLPSIPSMLFPPEGLNFRANFRSQVLANPSFLPGGNFQEPSLSTVVSSTRVVHQQTDVPYPERPGQPECPYFMKTGDCKYRSACKFHHPRSRLIGTFNCNISPLGLPLRPDQPICAFYNRFGICKFGPACKFHHPMDLACSSPAIASSVEALDGEGRTKEGCCAGRQ